LRPALNALKPTGKIGAKQSASSDSAAAAFMDSAFMTIVQRPPRILLLLKQMLEETPEGHPDHQAVEENCRRAGEILKKIDNGAGIPGSNLQLSFIKSRLGAQGKSAEWDNPSLHYIDQFKGPSQLLLFFAGELRILRTLPDNRLELESRHRLHDIMRVPRGLSELVILSDRNQIVVDVGGEWGKVLRTLREAALSPKGDASERIQIVWREIEVCNSPRSEHVLFWAQNQHWIFGGYRKEVVLTADVEILGLERVIIAPPEKLCPRSQFAFVQLGDRAFYIYGGFAVENQFGDM
jgi:hypothetical protein